MTMTNNLQPNQVKATDSDEFDDVFHYIHRYPKNIPADQIRPKAGETAVEYVWSEHMDIDPTTGAVSVDILPNMEFRPTNGTHYDFPFVVAATDGLNITLQDVNFEVQHNVEPPVWGSQPTSFTASEENTVSIQFNAYDPEQGVLVYTIVGNFPNFTITADGLLTGTAPVNATQIVKDVPFTIRATSSNSDLTADLPCVLHVLNNNRGPSWLSASVYNVLPGQFAETLQAADREDDTPITYSIVGAPNGFSIDGSTLKRTNPEQTLDYSVTVRATSGTGNRARSTDQTITVKVTDFPNDPPVWVTPAGSIGGGNSGDVFNFQLVATDTQLVTYTIASGSLPAGLIMSPVGVISGTLPQVNIGTSISTFTVEASDGENVVPRTFSISVSKLNLPPVWNTTSGLLIDAFPSEPIDIQLSATDPEGAAVSYTITKPASLSWLNMTPSGRLTGRVPAGTEPTQGNIYFTVTASDGTSTTPREFQVRINEIVPRTVGYNTTTTLTVDRGVYQIMVTWAIGAGAGGGAGHEMGNGGGGAGGGGGAFVRHTIIDVVPGDTLQFEIGQGGIGFVGSNGIMGYGGDGQSTRILKNGVVVVTADGGKGGGTSPNFGGGYLPSVAGAGGAPNGIPGTVGQIGTNDRASCYGGTGGRGPLINSVGGARGEANGGSNYTTGPGAGKSGIGYGAGGGGGGSQDRINKTRQYWKGGNGNSGYVEITVPSLGVITDENHPHYGTKPWAATGTTPPIGGGGGGGGGCCWDGAYLPNGKTIGETLRGEELILLNKKGDGYRISKVRSIRSDIQRCFKITTESGIELTCSDSTPIVVKTDDAYKAVMIGDGILMEMVPVMDTDGFRWELVTNVVDVGMLPVKLISANGGVYAAGNTYGRYIFTHNINQIDDNQKV